jgi:predicted PurR-regulated permease PerM
MKQNKTYLHLGVTLIVSACAVLMFYDTFFQSRVLLDFFDKLMSVLSPVIYGLAFAYLLAPIVDFFDRYIQKGLPKVKSSLVRGLSILVTWICVIALIYLMFSILIPELVDSTKTLADNFESYYKTVYNWVNSLVENQAIFSDDIYSDQLLSALNG